MNSLGKLRRYFEARRIARDHDSLPNFINYGRDVRYINRDKAVSSGEVCNAGIDRIIHEPTGLLRFLA